MEEVTEKRKESIKSWLKDRNNLAFLGILALAVIIRLYYFSITKSQPLWWDEADYLAYAKNLAGLGVSWIVTQQHNSLFTYIVAGFFKIGFGEATIKLLLEVVPSIASVVLVYLICKEMYKDKRIGLVASFLLAVFWDYLFNTTRFHVDVPALFFGLLTIYVFWKGYENKERIFGKINPWWAIPLAVIFAVVTYSIRRGYFLFGGFILIYMLSTKNWKELAKEKYNWIGAVMGVALFFIVERTIFYSEIAGVAGKYYHEELPINLIDPLGVFKASLSFGTIFSSILFYIFLIGLAVLVFELALSFGHIRNDKEKKADLFHLITIAVTLALFIFILRTKGTFGEVRWYYPLMLGAFVCVSRGGIFISQFFKKYSKNISAIILILLIGIGGYYQLKTADSVIKDKVETYEGMREAGLLLKEISGEEDKIITLGQPQVEYYSERGTIHAREWVDADSASPEHLAKTLEKIKETPNAKYLVISFSEPGYPDWMKRIGTVNMNGQILIATWEIPFMETKIDLINNKQDIKAGGTIEGVTFTLVDIKRDVFIYKIDTA